MKVRAEFDILPEVEYLNQGYKGLEINITTPDSVEDLLFHYVSERVLFVMHCVDNHVADSGRLT